MACRGARRGRDRPWTATESTAVQVTRSHSQRVGMTERSRSHDGTWLSVRAAPRLKSRFGEDFLHQSIGIDECVSGRPTIPRQRVLRGVVVREALSVVVEAVVQNEAQDGARGLHDPAPPPTGAEMSLHRGNEIRAQPAARASGREIDWSACSGTLSGPTKSHIRVGGHGLDRADRDPDACAISRCVKPSA